MQVNGDQDYPGENDTFKLTLDPVNNTLLDIYVNTVPAINGTYLANQSSITYQVPLASLTQINVNGLGGNNALVVNDSNGLINVPIEYNGGTGFNTLTLDQPTGVAVQGSDVYSVGPNPGEGTDVIATGAVTQTIYFQNLAPTFDSVPAITATVNATPASNAINYTTGLAAPVGISTTTGAGVSPSRLQPPPRTRS